MVIEDLVSTGGSSLTAVNSLRNAGAQVEGMCALFTYAFDVADIAFAEAKCNLYTIGDYPSLIKYAIQNNIIAIETESQLNEWRQNPLHGNNNNVFCCFGRNGGFCRGNY